MSSLFVSGETRLMVVFQSTSGEYRDFFSVGTRPPKELVFFVVYLQPLVSLFVRLLHLSVFSSNLFVAAFLTLSALVAKYSNSMRPLWERNNFLCNRMRERDCGVEPQRNLIYKSWTLLQHWRIWLYISIYIQCCI